MSLARRAARAALAASFISGGIDQIRNPQPKAAPASPIAKPIADRVPQLPNDPESLVKLDGAIKVVGGLGLSFGPFARPAALLLAGSLVPTTLAGHRFWETTDPEQRVSRPGRVLQERQPARRPAHRPRWTPAAGRRSPGWPARPRTARPRPSATPPRPSARPSPARPAPGRGGRRRGRPVTGVAGAVATGAAAVGGGSPSLSKRAGKALAKAEKRQRGRCSPRPGADAPRRWPRPSARAARPRPRAARPPRRAAACSASRRPPRAGRWAGTGAAAPSVARPWRMPPGPRRSPPARARSPRRKACRGEGQARRRGALTYGALTYGAYVRRADVRRADVRPSRTARSRTARSV